MLKHVGRHSAPCPDCGDTWQWPTVSDRDLRRRQRDKSVALRATGVRATCFCSASVIDKEACGSRNGADDRQRSESAQGSHCDTGCNAALHKSKAKPW